VAHVKFSGHGSRGYIHAVEILPVTVYDADLDGLRPANKPPALLLGNHPDPVDPKSLPSYQPPNASGGVVMAQPTKAKASAPGLDRVGIPSSKMRRSDVPFGTHLNCGDSWFR
jgi:hypothetical protein